MDLASFRKARLVMGLQFDRMCLGPKFLDLLADTEYKPKV